MFLFSRDLGERLREQGKLWFGSNKSVNQNENQSLSKEIVSLEKLVNNEHYNKYPSKLTATATGLTPEQCSQVLSTEFLEYLSEESKDK